jgi:SAM-dependent methyltransferase
MPNDSQLDYSGTELDAMSAAVNYHRWIVDKFRPYLGGTVAEVGAGIGSVSKLLLAAGVGRLLSFEPSTNMFPGLAQALHDEPRAQAINSFFSPHYAADGVDSVVYINVLEHIQDDRGEIRNALAALRPGGHLLVFVPALAWLTSDFDKHVGHFRRYTKRGLAQLAQDVGFEVVQAHYFDFAGVLLWYVSFTLLKGRPRRGSVAIYDQLVVPPMRLIESVFPPPIGKNILLVARKPV